MRITVNEALAARSKAFKVSSIGDTFLDAWLGDDDCRILESQDECFRLRESPEGVFGYASLELDGKPDTLEDATRDLYLRLFELLRKRPELRLLRIWNFVPEINREYSQEGGSREGYHIFNKARYEAYGRQYGGDPSAWQLPAASAVGSSDMKLAIEFFAVPNSPVYLENKAQIPARNYSQRFGSYPPVFARGAIWDNQGQRILISSGTAAIKGEDSLHHSDVCAQFLESIDNLRILVSQFNLRRHDVEFGFGLEDLQLLRIYYRDECDREALEKLARQAIDPDCCLSMVRADICRKELLVEIEGVFLKKGEYKGARRKYEVVEGRIRVESFELHVTEHCNLSCHMCDAMSPYNQKKFLALDEIESILSFLAKHVRSDIFKLMGGEPLLHPQLEDIIELVRKSGITDTIRLTTNGLLLHKKSDRFWESLDRLTVSNYSSAPMKEKHVQMAHEKARKFGVILNLKRIDQFNGVMIKTPLRDKARVQRIYDNCWVRHRSLVIRNGIFFKCTRAAYMDDFRREFAVARDAEDPAAFNSADGIPLDAHFFERALDYLNSPEPLHSCRYCFGASGKLIPHRQMSREEVQKRRLDEGVFYTD